MCPRCGERVLVPTPDDDEELAPTVPASDIASVAVECQLCGSRFYAKPDQLGQTMKCPDCYTANVVAQAPSRAPQDRKVEPANDDDDFKLSEPIDTPRYQALSRDALEFERAIRSADGMETKPLDVPPKPRANTQSDQPPRPATATPGPSAPASSAPASSAPALPELGDDDLVLLDTPATESQASAPPPSAPLEPAAPGELVLFPEDHAPPAPVAPPAARSTSQRQPAAAQEAFADIDDDTYGVDVPLAAAEERFDHRPVVKMPKPDAPEDKDDGSEVDLKKLKQAFRNFLPAGSAAALPPELAERRPFASGIFSVMQQPVVLGQWFVLVIPVAIELWAIDYIFRSFRADAGSQIMALFALVGLMIAVLPTLAIAVACWMSMLEDTANGYQRIVRWPDFFSYEWMGGLFYLLAAVTIAGAPALPVALLFNLIGLPTVLTPFIFYPCVFLLFPLIMLSMIENDSVTVPMSKQMLGSLKPLARFWGQFYLRSFGIGLLGVIAFSLSTWQGWLTIVPAAIIVTAVPILYFRMLGRMAMMYRDYVAATSPGEDDDTGNAARYTVH